MTTFRLSLSELAGARTRRNAIVAALVLIACMLAAAATLLPESKLKAEAKATLVLAKSSTLLHATTGAAAVDLQATGGEAKLINAALPFASGPIYAARPFALAGSSTEQERALLCLTQAVYYEAGFEPLAGRRAVAQVVLNRLRHPAFPKSVCGVVYQSNGRVCQFTFACDGALNRPAAAASWRQAGSIARAALAGHVEAAVGSATHYHADYVAPRWAPLLAKVAKFGQHIFYRWPGAWGQPRAFTGRYIGEPSDPVAMRTTVLVADAAPEQVEAAVIASPPVARAVNDVGGLLDTSKGWKLSIPGPDESSSAASRLIAAQERTTAAAAVATQGAGPLTASR